MKNKFNAKKTTVDGIVFGLLQVGVGLIILTAEQQAGATEHHPCE